MFSHDGETSTVSPGSSTPLTLEFVPATACASTEAGRAVSDEMASRPILLASPSVNHRLPSGPAVSAIGADPAVGVGNSVTTPDGVIRPILFVFASANQRLPSGPVAMPSRLASAVGIGNSVITPVGVMRPMLLVPVSVNQMLPSGPPVMP